MDRFRPKYVTFDCRGTLINFQMAEAARDLFGHLDGPRMDAEQAGSYKPHLKAFEYTLDMLGCGPEDITHLSSSFRHDLMSAYDLGIKSKVWVRGHEPSNPTTSTRKSPM